MGKPGKTKMVKLGPQQKYGLKMDHGAKQMNKPGLHKHGHYGMQQKYGMHQESAKQERKNLLKDMPVDDRAGTKQMKTGLYQDRMNGKLPQNPVLMQYGMDKNAIKQVGKYMAMPQVEGGEDKVVAGNKNKGMLDEFTVEAKKPKVYNVNIGKNWKGDYVKADASEQPAADYNAAFTKWASTAEGYGGFNERVAKLRATGKTEDARQANAAIRLAKQDFNRTDLGRNLMTKVHDSSIAPDEGGNRKTMSVRSDQLSKYGFSDEG